MFEERPLTHTLREELLTPVDRDFLKHIVSINCKTNAKKLDVEYLSAVPFSSFAAFPSLSLEELEHECYKTKQEMSEGK